MKVYKLNVGTKHQIAADPWNTFVSGAFNGTFKGTSVEVDGYIRLNPVATSINNSISASYIYVSGSTNDLYFTQNGNGYANTTRLRWLEGNLYTGLLNGGIVTATIGSNTYQVSSGSGIIVNLNASYNDNPYPTVQYVNWGNLTTTIDALSASYDQQFIAIDNTANIFAQGTPYVDGDYNTKIPIGVVLHQNRSTVNAAQTFPSVAYGWKQRSSDFIRAFGPLKISGYVLSPSGSSTRGLVLSGGTAWVDGRNYIVDPNNPSYIVEASGITTSKIFRYYQSGSNWESTWGYNTNGGAGYTDVDPTLYSNLGTLTSVSTNHWTIQRVFYFPNSATKAFYIYYGNDEYANESDALAAVATETFTEAPNTAANAIYVGFMLLRHNADFTTPASYTFYQAGLFRAIPGGGAAGGGGVTALSSLTDVSINSPLNGQVLVYNSVTSKWENSPSASISASYATTASYIDPLYISASAAFYGFGAAGGSTSPGGTTTQIQYNNSGVFGGVPTLIYNGSLHATGSFSGSFKGDGSQLINLPVQSIDSGSFVLTSSFNTYTGSIQTQINNLTSATSSYVLNSVTASMLQPYVLTNTTASMLEPYVLNNVTSSMLAPYTLNSVTASMLEPYVLNSVTASMLQPYVLTSSTASMSVATASFIELARSASYALQAISASYSTLAQTADTASYVLNAISSSFASTASYVQLAQTASYVLQAVSASYSTLAQTANTASYVVTAQTASYVLQAVSSSFASTASYVENAQTASYVLNGVSSSFAATASYIQNAQSASYVLQAVSASYASVANSVNTLNQDVTIAGSLTINQNLTVLGSSSISYVTSSQLNISTNLITVNTLNPGVRFGGLAVIDSGSSPQVSGSFLFDSQKNEFIFVHQGTTTTSSIFLLGPETYNNIGNEIYLTQNRLPKGSGIEHLYDSNITDTGTVVSINSNTQVTGSLTVSGGITGTVTTASYVLQAVSSSYAATVSPAGPNNSVQFNNNGILSGSSFFTYDAANTQLQHTGSILASGTVNVAGTVTATSFSGNGSSLTGIIAATASYVNGSRIKSNAVSAGSFTGNPKKATVTFGTAYPDTSYSITITGEDARTWTIESKLAGSFVINSNSNTAPVGTTYWQTINYGEFNA